MKNKLILIIIGVLSLTAFTLSESCASLNSEEIEISSQTKTVVIEEQLLTKPTIYNDITYVELYDIDASFNQMQKAKLAIEDLSNKIISAEYSNSAIAAMRKEVARLQNIADSYYEDIGIYSIWEHDFNYAAKTWEFFKQRGYSDAAVFGIIGNMMIETSGGSILLEPIIYNPSGNYYGLCQWSIKYYPEIKDKSFEDQLLFLDSTIEAEFNTFGKLYSNDFKLEDFKNMTDPADAALAFAKVYERCGYGSYNLRMQAALDAENYFVK